MVENTVNGLFNPVMPPATRIGRYDAHARMRGDVRFTACRRVQTASASALALTSKSNSEPIDNVQRRRLVQRGAHQKRGCDALDASTLSDFARDHDDNVDELDESVTTFLSANTSLMQLLPENVSSQVAHFAAGGKRANDASSRANSQPSSGTASARGAAHAHSDSVLGGSRASSVSSLVAAMVRPISATHIGASTGTGAGRLNTAELMQHTKRVDRMRLQVCACACEI